MLIQTVTSVIVLFLMLRLVQRYRRKQISLRRLAVWGLMWVGVGLVVLNPQIADRVAARMGIETATGIDFLVYIAVGVGSYVLFRLFIRLDRIENNLTTLVRHIALMEQSRK